MLIASNFVYLANSQINPLIVFDDDSSPYWTNLYSWGLSDDDEDYMVNDNSLKVVVPAHSIYEAITHPFYHNLSDYDVFGFWIKGNNTGLNIRYSFFTDSTNFYYIFINDNFYNWGYFTFDKADFPAYNTPDWEVIQWMEISLSGDNGDEMTLHYDWCAFWSNVSYPYPTPTPSPTPTPISTEPDLSSTYVFIITILLLIASIYFAIKPHPIMGVVINIMIFFIGVAYLVTDSTLPLNFPNPIFTIIVLIIAGSSLICQWYDYKRPH